MLYSTSDYLSDRSPYFYFFFKAAKFVSKKIKVFLDKASEVEYDVYILRIFENLPYGILILYLGFLSVLTLFRISEKGNGIRVIAIVTNSMSPAIAPGSLVLTQKTNSYQKGDIITFKEVSPTTGEETGRTLTHRIVYENDSGGRYITKGDSNIHPDPTPVTKEKILGKVSHVIGYFGYFDLAIRTFTGFIILILVPTLTLIKNEANYLKGANLKTTLKS